MKKTLQILITTVLLSGCKQQAQQQNTITALNGYWEIKKVTLPDNSEKLYNYNQVIDFFELRGSTGIRKKVQPKLDGTFITTKSIENFTLRKENDSLRIYYKTTLTSWKETIITIDTTQLILKNNQGIIYQYKPYKKLAL